MNPTESTNIIPFPLKRNFVGWHYAVETDTPKCCGHFMGKSLDIVTGNYFYVCIFCQNYQKTPQQDALT